MKVIDLQEADESNDAPSPLDNVLSSLRLGRDLDQDSQAQDWIVNTLADILDHSYVMVRNLSLEGLEAPIPLILVGPPGIRVIHPSSQRGVFRVKGDSWEEMDDRQQQYKSVLPNMIARTRLMANAVDDYLNARDYPAIEVEPVLMFTDPGTHVETVRPDVRVVMSDGLERFCVGLMQDSAQLEREVVQRIADLFSQTKSAVDQAASQYPERDAFSFADESAEKQKPSLRSRLPNDEPIVTFINRLPFTNRQWIVLGILAAVNILILMGFVLYVLFTF